MTHLDCAALGGSRCGARCTVGARRSGGACTFALGRSRTQIRQGRRSRRVRQGNDGRDTLFRPILYQVE